MPDVDRLQASIAERLRGAGVALPEARIAPLADAVLADAVQLALAWLEPENGPYWRPDHPPMEGTA